VHTSYIQKIRNVTHEHDSMALLQMQFDFQRQVTCWHA